jgi:hypothetical protein
MSYHILIVDDNEDVIALRLAYFSPQQVLNLKAEMLRATDGGALMAAIAAYRFGYDFFSSKGSFSFSLKSPNLYSALIYCNKLSKSLLNHWY